MNDLRGIGVRWCSMAILAVFAAVMLAATITPALAATQITTCTELQNIKANLAGDYYLASDIDCSVTSGWNGGAGFELIGNESNNFSGNFDSKGYKITGLYINRSSTNFVGLFGFTGSGSEIKDVGLEDVNVNGYGGGGSAVWLV